MSLGAETHFVSESDSVYSPLIGSVAVNGGETELWYLFDALGTTIGLSDADGALTDTRLYDAFGNILGSTGSVTTPFEYVGAYGYYTEPEIDQMLLWHRWYDVGIGRFGSRDRYRLWPTLVDDPYGYCFAAPNYATDPTGGDGIVMPVACAVAAACFGIGLLYALMCTANCASPMMRCPEHPSLCDWQQGGQDVWRREEIATRCDTLRDDIIAGLAACRRGCLRDIMSGATARCWSIAVMCLATIPYLPNGPVVKIPGWILPW